MKRQTVFAIASALVALGTSAYAQAPTQASPELRVQVKTMETVFATAVRGGVLKIARKIQDAAPGLRVVSGDSRAHGYAVDGHGWFFDVEVPELQWSTIDLYYDLQRPPQRATPAPNLPVGNPAGARVTPPAVAEPDSNQLREDFRRVIRDGLMDAILDFGQVPLKPTETLTVGARSVDSPDPALDTDTVTLVLQITGEDLSLFRQTKITREEAKKRIKVQEDHR